MCSRRPLSNAFSRLSPLLVEQRTVRVMERNSQTNVLMLTVKMFLGSRIIYIATDSKSSMFIYLSTKSTVYG